MDSPRLRLVGIALCGFVSAGLLATIGAWILGHDPSNLNREIALIAGFGGLFAGLVGFLHVVFPIRSISPRSHDLSISDPASLKKNRRRGATRHRPSRREALLSLTFRWLKVSPGLRNLLRNQDAKLLGKSLIKVLYPEDLAIFDQAFSQVIKTGTRVILDARFIRGPSKKTSAPANHQETDTNEIPVLDQTQIRHLRVRLTPRKDTTGKVTAVRADFRDRTALARSRNEATRLRVELQNAERRVSLIRSDLERLKDSYRDLYHNAPVMYFSLTPDGAIVTCNETLLNAIGFTREDLSNQNYSILLPPASVLGASAESRRVPIREGVIETQWRKSDGHVIDVWIRTVPIFDIQGLVVRFRSVALDLSEKNQLSNELRRRGDELERANRRLRIINSQLEDFTHVVSHDLKEPLRTLQAYSQLLAEEASDQLGVDGFQYVNHLLLASRRLGLLIDDLLTLSQVGKATREWKVFNLHEIVATVRRDLGDLIQRRQAFVLTEGSMATLAGDPARITQLLENLVANGLKYNQSHPPEIHIGTVASNEPQYVTVYVRDNGIGIDPKYHEQVFGLFRRLHASHEYEGTGAGLAICKKIVEAHGGRIWVESAVGQGSTFYFSLPQRLPGSESVSVVPKMVVEPARPIQRIPSPANSEVPLSGLLPRETTTASPVKTKPTIVLVEDLAEVGTVIQKLGKRSNVEVRWYATAEDAWNYLRQNSADLLLFDLHLPGMNGLELCKLVRGCPLHETTPIAIFSQEENASQTPQFQAIGANHFLSKDLLCQPAKWQKKIQELLKSAG